MSEDKTLAEQIEVIHDKLVTEILDNILTESGTLFHYTTLESAHSIISSGQLRFTNALYLNDPTEIKNGLDIAARVFNKLITFYRSEDPNFKVDLLAVLYFRLTFRFTLPANQSKIFERLSAELAPLVSQVVKNLFDTMLQESPLSLYIASFSEKSDDLRQWLPYADDARGMAIGFIELKKGRHNIIEREGVWLTRVCYKSDAEKERYLEAFLVESLALLDPRTSNFTEYLDKVTDLLVVDLVACKSEHYRDEAEWRLFFVQSMSDVLGNSDGKKLEFYLKNGLLKPYHTEKLAFGAIKELKLGSRCDDELNLDAFKMFFYLKLGTVPKVTKSSVIYRG